MSTWIVPELQADFDDDFEDLLMPYLFDKWSITVPIKGTVPRPDMTLEPDTVSFKVGFPDFNRPYEVCVIQTKTDPIEKQSGKWTFTTTIEVMLRMLRIDRNAIDVDPQLENMEQEIQRIVESYPYNDITGIKDIFFDPISTERIYDAKDNWAKSDWRSIVRIKLFYQKDNLLT